MITQRFLHVPISTCIDLNSNCWAMLVPERSNRQVAANLVRLGSTSKAAPTYCQHRPFHLWCCCITFGNHWTCLNRTAHKPFSDQSIHSKHPKTMKFFSAALIQLAIIGASFSNGQVRIAEVRLSSDLSLANGSSCFTSCSFFKISHDMILGQTWAGGVCCLHASVLSCLSRWNGPAF